MEDTTQKEIKRSISETFTESQISIGTPWRIFVFSFLLFLFSIFIYFGLRLGYENYLESRSKNLDQKMNELSNSVSEEDQKQIISIYSQIINLRDVLDSHIFSFNVFPFLEKNTLDKVFYKKAEFISEKRTLNLDGEAENLSVLSSQIAQFENAKDLESATLTSMKFNPSGNISFSVSLVFKKDYLLKPI